MLQPNHSETVHITLLAGLLAGIIGHVYGNEVHCLWVSHNALFRNSQTHSVTNSIYDFD